MRRVVRRVRAGWLARAAALALMGTAVLVSPPAAHATPDAAAGQCRDFDLADSAQVAEKAAAADAIFEGRVVATEKRDRSSGDVDFANTVKVLVPYQGDLAADERVTVVTGRSRDDGLGRLTEKARYLFFATEQRSGALIATRCGGTTELDGTLEQRFSSVLEQVIADAEEPEVVVTLAEPEGGTTTPPSLGRSVAPGLALGLAGMLGLAVVVGVGSRRQH